MGSATILLAAMVSLTSANPGPFATPWVYLSSPTSLSPLTSLSPPTSLAPLQLPNIEGTWEVTLKDQNRKDVPRSVVVRADSSASWGEEHVRWRVVRGPKIMLAIGGEWETYDIRLRGNQLTLSGGDLPDPVTLRRTGPATPRPADVPVPPDPDRPRG